MSSGGASRRNPGGHPLRPRRCESILDRLTWEGEAPAEPKGSKPLQQGRLARRLALPNCFTPSLFKGGLMPVNSEAKSE
jgi:hypothetical protein